MKPDKVRWKPPDGMSQNLFKFFEKFRLGVPAGIPKELEDQEKKKLKTES